MDRKCNIIADNGCESKILKIKSKITEENLIKISNKGIYKRGLKDLELISEAEISYNSEFIIIKFADIEVSVKEDFSGVLCSCQSKTVCRHIITGLLMLGECMVNKVAVEIETPEIISTKEEPERDIQEEKSIAVNKEYINKVIEFIQSVSAKGIINCNESDIDTAVQLSLKAENTVHGNISLMLRSFSKDIENMLMKSAEFVSIDTFHRISRIYNTASAILKNENSYDMLKILCVDNENGYQDMGIVNFAGLGAYPWSTKSGYTGITSFLYCIENEKIYTYSSSLANIHEKTKNFSNIENLSRSFKNHVHWQNSASMMQISCSSFKLFNGKANNLNRISSSKNTVMNIAGFTTLEQLETFKNLSVENCFNTTEEYDYFSVKQAEKICIIYAENFENIFYNKAKQVLEFELSDGENIYPCEILWTEQNKNAISRIESLAKRGINGRKAIICRYFKGIFTPISEANNLEIISFYFD